MTAVGYRCCGCGAPFLFHEYDENWHALRAVRRHISDEHNTANDSELIRDTDR